MGIGFSEALLLISGGSLLFSLFALIHFSSCFNRHNLSLAFSSAVVIGIASIYSATISSAYGILESLELAMSSAFIGLLELLPIFLAVNTIVLFRISLLTNRSVDASS